MGWVTILFVAGLLTIYQSVSYRAPAALCNPEAGCHLLAIWVFRLCFVGLALGSFLVFPNTLKLVHLSVLFALLVGEAGYRIHDSYLNQKYPQEEAEEVSPIPTYDKVLGWKMNPNIEVFYK